MKNPTPTLIISAEPESPIAYCQKLWQYRAMVLALARRDWKAKYAQTLVGILWSVLQPLIGLLIFSFFFEKVVRISDAIPYAYAIFAFSGMTCWFYFTQHLNQGGTALLQEQTLLKKIYFPRLLLPIAKAVAGLADYSISLILLMALLLWKGVYPGAHIIYLPLFILLNVITALSFSIWLSALTIRFRDFNHLIPYLVGFSIWLTPVFYPVTLVPEQYHFLLYCNPMAAVIEGFRWSLIGIEHFNSNYLIGITISFILLSSGFIYFFKIEHQISDFI